MDNEFNATLPAFYSDWAEDYAQQFWDELDGKPRDRELLTAMVHSAAGGLICDLGCGPGHISAMLRAQHASVEGIDISEGMVACAKARTPGVVFRLGSFFSIPAKAHTYAAVVAFYSIIHAPKDRLVDVFREIRRVLVPRGALLASFHEGDGHVLREDVVFNFFTSQEVMQASASAGLVVERVELRPGYESENGDWNRMYLLARSAR